MKCQLLTEEQYKKLSRTLVNNIEKNHKIVPLNSLKHHKYTLKRPVYITIEYDRNTVIASLPDIESFATGDTEYEAINGLCIDIVNLYEDLKLDRENLGKLPGQWLQYLEEIIEDR